ncbi:hypothetical protein CUC15_01435 [Oceanobacillus zhaokaii]|jgi:hypothetical protein|uniref:DUF3231 family protein n=1 Tax=Oceanobacillus zhaokaii TaxID=2052660 RepID=A0A345PCJ4_9BACI|nr:DUF3231 family protein [Oceanobacillus zhaokaii]AXI07724.1 hypothetical protein CUC15_01435 [Oceanobacillus zhaokaii]
MGINNSKNEPLHSGEVFHLWSYLYSTKGTLVTLQVLINHTGDHDLKVYLEDLLESNFTQEEQQVENLLKESGIRLPPAPPDKPNVEVQDIPAGARFNDPEIATLVQKELMTGRILCNYITGIAIREDLRTMFSEFSSQREEYEIKLQQVSKEKGWIVPPPINTK